MNEASRVSTPWQQWTPTLRFVALQCSARKVDRLTLVSVPAERHNRNVESQLAAVDTEVDKMLACLPHGRQPAEEDVIAMR